MRKNKQFYFRKIHRYLGLFIGIQLLLWTVGGLYFSWSDMDQIHGDTLLKEKNDAKLYSNLISPDSVFNSIKNQYELNGIKNFRLVELLDESFYDISFYDQDGQVNQFLYNAQTGKIRDHITQEEAISIASKSFNQDAKIINVNLLQEKDVDSHHEYREKPLPAWQIEFDHPSKSRIYVSSITGELINLRNKQWRRFDFLWMLHTMDYAGRDNITNWLLRLFSVLGLTTVISGFTLFYFSSPTINKLKKRKL